MSALVKLVNTTCFTNQFEKKNQSEQDDQTSF